MRFPFDLLAAILFVGEIDQYLHDNSTGDFLQVSLWTALAYWLGFLLLVWLINELVTRQAEWRTRFGLFPAGLPGNKHPTIAHAWSLRAAQFLTVGLFCGVLFALEWPLTARLWPAWIGLAPGYQVGGLALCNSSVVSFMLNLAPFLAAMVVSWIPRCRLASGIRHRAIPLHEYLAVEAKLTWIPLLLAALFAVFQDAAAILPPRYTAWADTPLNQLALAIGAAIFIGVFALPRIVIWLWRCTPLPDGELKARLLALVARSGVKARSILVWGSRSTGLMNACVIGPWSRQRYVLISPALSDELTLEETEGVLAHELGHARHGHLFFYFVVILGMAVLLDPISDLLAQSWHGSPLLQTGAVMAFVIFYIFGFFGSISRQCEREADLASAEMLGTPAPIVAALEKLALMMGNIRSVYCWHHGSIAQRVAAVQQLSADPQAGARLHARLRRLRWTVMVVTAVVLGWELLVKFKG